MFAIGMFFGIIIGSVITSIIIMITERWTKYE